jgi:hypothetical protein
MAKPILLVAIPHSLDWKQGRDIEQVLHAKVTDYHVLVYGRKIDEPEFKVLNAEDMPPLQFEELKALVEKEMQALNA